MISKITAPGKERRNLSNPTGARVFFGGLAPLRDLSGLRGGSSRTHLGQTGLGKALPVDYLLTFWWRRLAAVVVRTGGSIGGSRDVVNAV